MTIPPEQLSIGRSGSSREVLIGTSNPRLAWDVGRTLLRMGYRVSVSIELDERLARRPKSIVPKSGSGVVDALWEAAGGDHVGQVLCRSNTRVGRISFSDGRVVGLEISPSPLSLLDRLIEELELDPDIVGDIVHECEQVGGNVFEWLVELEHVDKNRLSQWLYTFYRNSLREVLEWENAQAMFLPGSASDATNGLVSFSLESLLMPESHAVL